MLSLRGANLLWRKQYFIESPRSHSFIPKRTEKEAQILLLEETVLGENLTQKIVISLKLSYSGRQWGNWTLTLLCKANTALYFAWEYLHPLVFPGIQTGACIPYNSSIKTCEVFAWCPVEDDYHIPKWELSSYPVLALLRGGPQYTASLPQPVFFPMGYYWEKLKRLQSKALQHQRPCFWNINGTYLFFLLLFRPAFLQGAENFTILVKNNIWYPKFNFSK